MTLPIETAGPPGSQGFDPRNFDHHDAVQMGDAHTEIYRLLRERCPVAHSERHDGFWVISRYEDCFEAAQDWHRFSSAGGVTLPKVSGPMPFIPIEIDPPALTRYRRLLLPHFSPAALAPMEPAIRAFTAQRVERLAAKGAGDLVAELATPVPMYAICRLLGVPEHDHEELHAWGASLAHGPSASGDDLDGALEAATNLLVYLADMIQDRREGRAKGNDLISVMCAMEDEGGALSDDEILSIAFLLLPAGFDTTEAGIAGSLLYLAEHQDVQQALAEDLSGVTTAVEELLRYESPVQAVHRVLTTDTTFRGQKLQKGESVLLLFGSADRDPAEFVNAESVDITRVWNRHFAFGVGMHRCLGANLARMEIRIVLEELLGRYRFEPTVSHSEMRRVPGHIRGLESLPARIERREGN